MAFCQKALANNDKNAAAYVVLGNCYVRQDDIKKAVEAYQAALKADPDQFEAKENLRRIESLSPGR
jgi:cytochrome c-type biogenesis protein CcmH/NrfG